MLFCRGHFDRDRKSLAPPGNRYHNTTTFFYASSKSFATANDYLILVILPLGANAKGDFWDV
jgi:hypothetical protein